MKPERKFTYLKKSETKDERVFNGDDPKENKAFFDALKADEKDRIESNKQSIDIFEKTLYKFSEILACEVKSKKDARELEVLVIDRIRALQVFRGKDEFSEKYNDLILFAESLLSQIETQIIDLPNTRSEKQEQNTIKTRKYTAKQYVLAYLFECNIQGVQPPTGKKKELEKIGNERMGVGRGNTFYKALNEISRKDLNIEKNLIDIGREDWKEAILEITLLPEKLNEYLKKKQL